MSHGVTNDAMVDALLETTGPDDLIDVLVLHAEARDPQIVTRLRNYAKREEATNKPKHARLESIAAHIAGILEFTDQLPTKSTPNSFLQSLNLAIVWHPSFTRLMLALARDNRRQFKRERTGAIVSFLLQRRAFAQAVSQAPKTSDTKVLYEYYSAHKGITFDQFDRWLEARSALGDKYSGSAAVLREELQNRRLISGIQQLPSDIPGYVTLAAKTTHWATETWFMYYAGGRAGYEFATGTSERTTDAFDRALRSNIDPSSPTTRSFSVSSFCEAVLRCEDRIDVDHVLRAYRDVIEHTSFAELDIDVQLTQKYRYSYAVSRVWRRSASQLNLLLDALDLLRPAIPLIKPKHPRLRRDMRVVAARLAEDIGEWQGRSFFALAAALLEESLADTTLAWESTQRVGALSDLANNLSRVPPVQVKRITDLFDEALALCPPEAPTKTGISVRHNFAIFLMDQVSDSSALVRARHLLAEAETLVPNLDEDTKSSQHTRGLVASMYETQANLEKQQGTTLDAVIAKYEVAIKYLDTDDPYFRDHIAHIYINMCHAYVEEWENTSANNLLYKAEACATSAGTFAVSPVTSAEASICTVLIDLAAGTPAADLLPRLAAAKATLEANGSLVRSHAATWRYLKIRSHSTSVDDRLQVLLELEEALRSASESKLLWEAVQYALGFADASGQLFSETSDPMLLERSAAILTATRDILFQRVDEDVLLVDGADVHRSISEISAELVWIHASRGRKLIEYLSDVVLAKNVDDAFEAACAILAKRESSKMHGQLLQHGEWQHRRAMLLGADNPELVDAQYRALLERAEARAIHVGQRRSDVLQASVKECLAGIESSTVRLLDITVSVHGTVLCLIGQGICEAKTIPLARSRAASLRRDWLRLYSQVNEGPTQKLSVQKHLHATLEQLSAEMIAVVAQSLPKSGGLVVVPHLLRGVPLHACAMPDSSLRLIDVTDSLCYASNLIYGRTAELATRFTGKGCLCIAVDPGGDEGLAFAMKETNEVAAILAAAGHPVTVAAVSDVGAGRAVFEDLGLPLVSGVHYVDPGNLRDWLIAHMSEFDHVLFSGHGQWAASGSELIIGRDGKSLATLDVVDVVANVALSPGCSLHLSACESSMGGGSMFSIADGFIRLGASLAIAAEWQIREGDALSFSRELYPLATSTGDWGVAVKGAIKAVRARLGDDDLFHWAPFALVVGSLRG